MTCFAYYFYVCFGFERALWENAKQDLFQYFRSRTKYPYIFIIFYKEYTEVSKNKVEYFPSTSWFTIISTDWLKIYYNIIQYYYNVSNSIKSYVSCFCLEVVRMMIKNLYFLLEGSSLLKNFSKVRKRRSLNNIQALKSLKKGSFKYHVMHFYAIFSPPPL